MRFSTKTTLLVSLACLCSRAWAQTTPTPKFDVVDSPITAPELANELGYEFYGATWKFSEPTYARVRVWSDSGAASEVPVQPPESAKPFDVFDPDKPLTELTVHALVKNSEITTNRHGSEYKRHGIEFKLKASGKEASEPLDPSGVMSGQMTFGSGAGTSISFSLEQGPDQGFNHEWRYANGNLGLVFEGAVAAAATGQTASTDSIIRDHMEAGMRAAPLKICYYKGEISGLSDQAKAEGNGGAFDQPKKRAVALVTLECSREPFKDDAKATPAPTATPTATTSPQ